MPRFPSGDAAFQERYLAAFEGLTRVLAPLGREERSEWPWAGEKWSEMFDNLIEEDHTREGDDE